MSTEVKELIERLRKGFGTAAGRTAQVNAYQQACCEAAAMLERLEKGSAMMRATLFQIKGKAEFAKDDAVDGLVKRELAVQILNIANAALAAEKKGVQEMKPLSERMRKYLRKYSLAVPWTSVKEKTRLWAVEFEAMEKELAALKAAQAAPGKVSARFSWLMDQLQVRLGIEKSVLSSPPEVQILIELDKRLVAQAAPAIFSRMEDGRIAILEAESALETILGIELLGIDFDTYDSSIEIYPMSDYDLSVSPEQHNKILALGCVKYWINFEDGTEIASGGERKSSAVNRWEAFNEGRDQKRQAAPVVSEEQALTPHDQEVVTELEAIAAGGYHKEGFWSRAIALAAVRMIKQGVSEVSNLRAENETLRSQAQEVKPWNKKGV